MDDLLVAAILHPEVGDFGAAAMDAVLKRVARMAHHRASQALHTPNRHPEQAVDPRSEGEFYCGMRSRLTLSSLQ